MTSYSIFWDYFTTPLMSDFPLENFIVTLENKFYPKSKPVRSDCVIFTNTSSKVEPTIGKLGSNLKICGFKLIEYTLRQSNADVINVCEKYSEKSEITDLLLISGKHDFLVTLFYASDDSKNRNIISDDKLSNEFEWPNKLIMFKDIVLDALRKFPSKTDPNDCQSKTHGKTEKNIAKNSSKFERDGQSSIKSDGKTPTSTTSKKTEILPKRNYKNVENKELCYLCLLTFDYDRRNELINTFETCLNAFKGRVLTGWNGVCVIEFRSKSNLTDAEPFLCSLYPITGLRMNSITVIDRITRETLDFNNGEKVSNRLGENNKSDKISDVKKELTVNIEPHCDKNSNQEVNSDDDNDDDDSKISSTKSASNSNSQNDESQKPGGLESLENGYFLTFTDLVIDERPEWYRSQILKLLGNIQTKFIYFDLKLNWAMIQFGSENGRSAAQKILQGAKFPGKSVVLNPDRTSTISSSYIKRIKCNCKFYNWAKNTAAEKPKTRGNS